MHAMNAVAIQAIVHLRFPTVSLLFEGESAPVKLFYRLQASSAVHVNNDT